MIGRLEDAANKKSHDQALSAATRTPARLELRADMLLVNHCPTALLRTPTRMIGEYVNPKSSNTWIQQEKTGPQSRKKTSRSQ
jgi:hypothetical protein